MTGTWTDSDLDKALRELAGVLDPDPTVAPLAAVRTRLAVPVTSGPDGAVVEIAAVRVSPPGRRRRRVAPALLVAATVVAAVALAGLFWPRGGGRVTPAQPPPGASSPTVTSAPDLVRRDLTRLPDPVPPAGAAVLFATEGVGDAQFAGAFAAPAPTVASGQRVVLTYAFVCGDPGVLPPTADTRPSDLGAVAYTLDDHRGLLQQGTCYAIGGDSRAGGWATTSPPDAQDRNGLRVAVPNAGVVWKVVVWVAPAA